MSFVPGPCPSCGGAAGAGVDAEQDVLCDVQPDGSTVQFVRRFVYSADGSTITDTVDTLLDGSVYTPTGTVGACDPYRLCTPDSSVDVNGTCGPGQPVENPIIAAEGDSTDSVINDDPSADPLCGGSWDRPSEAAPAPFPVNETFRNATFDQPGPVTQGTPPYAALTASGAGTSNIDPAGQGWLQTSDINSFTNGMWQVPAPFPTANGATVGITFASHDGTGNPNGDGMAFVFTDGSVPPQSTAIGGGGGLGLQNWQGGYVAIVLDEFGGTGAGPNTISIQGAGATQGTFAAPPINVAPHNISADTDRPTPGRLITSIITEAGQTYVSASILWSGDSAPTVYYDRVNVTPTLGAAPTTLRMAVYGGSGGAFRSEHEFRDAVANAAGLQEWRAFPLVTDPIPACATNVSVNVCVDVTVAQDTQAFGNADPEAFLWLVNSATNTVLDKAQFSSQPSQVGNVRNLCVNTVVPKAQLPDLRIYVGAETRDNAGVYGTAWENLQIDVAALGCPSTSVRTIAISAPCPLPVTIVSGTPGTGGGAGGNTVVNTPSAFEDQPVCMMLSGVESTGFRRELRGADGTVTITFLSTDGAPVVPDAWTPGPCVRDVELVELCDQQAGGVTIPFIRRFLFDETGAVVAAANIDAIGAPYVPTGVVTTCSLAGLDVEHTLLCDLPSGTPFIRTTLYSPNSGGFVVDVADYQINGSTPYVVVGTAGVCFPDNTFREIATQVLCDDVGSFLRTYEYNSDTGLPSGFPDDTTLDGTTPYFPTGTVHSCDSATATLVRAHHFDVVPGTPWTPAAIPALQTLVGLSYTVVTGTVTTLDSDGTSIAAIPAGFTESWSAALDRDSLLPPTSITAAAASRAIVTMTTR